MIKENEAILAEVKALLGEGKCSLLYDADKREYILTKLKAPEPKVSAFATEGPQEGIWAFFESHKEAILFMKRKGVPFRIY